MSDADYAASAQHIAEHYNAQPDRGLKARAESRLFYMRSMNNWVKSVLIGEYLLRVKEDLDWKWDKGPPVRVLDLCCGKGGDLQKWKIGRISYLVCIDIAETSLLQCKSRYAEMLSRLGQERRGVHLFDMEAICIDLGNTLITPLLRQPSMQFDLASCQFSLHYLFSSYARVRMFVRNVSDHLKPGGYFVGTIPNADYLLAKARTSAKFGEFGAEGVYHVRFDPDLIKEGNRIPLFGLQYSFWLSEAVDCPEYLAFFPILEKLFKDVNMEIVYKKSFPEFINEYCEKSEGKRLLSQMQSLEPYPPDADVTLLAGSRKFYAAAEKKWQELAKTRGADLSKKIGTLSEQDWEVNSLYLAFAFRKISESDKEEVDSNSE